MNRKIFEQLKKRGFFSLLADGESMLPLLHSKDLVSYKKISYSKIKVNDIILVFKNNLAFTHRVIYKTDKYLVTKGDNNLKSDCRVSPKQIIGKVSTVKRKNKIFDPEMLYLIQSSIYFKEIVKIVRAFEKNNINYVFLKGLPIHLYYEKTHPRRIYQDADVLIDKQNFESAKKILIKSGYKLSDSFFSPIQKKMRDKIVEISFYKLVNGFPVVFDIHLEPAFLMTQIGNLEALYPQQLIDQLTKELLKTKKVVKINGETFFILNTNYLILYLCLHFFHHNFTGAFRLELIDKIIKKSPKNLLKKINKLEDQYRLTNFVDPVFLLLKKYHHTPLPSSIFDDEDRLTAGISRFKNIFLSSLQPLYIKIFVFFDPKVIYMVYFALKSKIKSLLKNSFIRSRLNV